MYKQPPLIATDYTPEQIVGSHNMQALAGHIKHFEANKDKAGRQENTAMSEIINRLHEHGYRINGFDKHGNIDFMVVLKSQVQQRFEGPELEHLKGLSLPELQAIGRGGYRQIMSEQKQYRAPVNNGRISGRDIDRFVASGSGLTETTIYTRETSDVAAG